MPRSQVSYGSDIYTCMKFGRLNVIAKFDVMGGENFSAQIKANVGFHPHRRPGARIKSELFAFYAPKRWSYGQIVKALTEGYDGTTNWGGTTTVANRAPECLATLRQTVPNHWLNDYASIIEHHFKEPHITTEVTASNVLTTDADKEFGYLCWQIKNTPQTRLNWSDAHDETSLGSDPNALDLAKYVAIAREEQTHEWEAIRTEDIYRKTYGGKLSKEVLAIPVLLGHEATMTRMKGQEVDRAQDISMGRNMAAIGMNIPRWPVHEHGTVYVLHLSRIVPRYFYGEDLLHQPTNFSQTKLMAGNPVTDTEKPVEMTLAKMFMDSESTLSLGWKPFGQWHEESTGFIHSRFKDKDEGWHFRNTPSSKEGLHRHPEYEDIVTTKQFGHGQIIAQYGVRSQRRKTVSSVKAPAVGDKQGTL